MEAVHLYVSLRLLGLPVEEQSAGYNGLLPPTQSCKYSLASLSPSVSLCFCVSLCVVVKHTDTHILFMIHALSHTDYFLHLLSWQNGQSTAEDGVTPAVKVCGISETHTHANMTQYSCSLTSSKLDRFWIEFLAFVHDFLWGREVEGEIPNSKGKFLCESAFWAISIPVRGGRENSWCSHTCLRLCHLWPCVDLFILQLNSQPTEGSFRLKFNVLNTVRMRLIEQQFDRCVLWCVWAYLIEQ